MDMTTAHVSIPRFRSVPTISKAAASDADAPLRASISPMITVLAVFGFVLGLIAGLATGPVLVASLLGVAGGIALGLAFAASVRFTLRHDG